jgi:putative ABC transport system permease protein
MDTLYKDLRFGVRSLLKHPAFTALAVITLALGIGANTAIFTVVDGVLLRPLNFPEPERLVVLNERNAQQNTFELSYLNWLEVTQRSQSFEEIAGVIFTSYVMDLNGETSRVSALQISANLFPTLRARPKQGRTFLKEDERPGAEPVVVVSNSFWQRYFGNQVLSGQGIRLDNRSYSVVGVMPPEFQFPDEKMEVWVPFGPDTEDKMFQNRAVHLIYGLGRLKEGIEQSQASVELDTIFSGIQQQHPGEDEGHTVSLTALHERITGNVKPALLVLLGAVALVLLIACANVAGLQLARAASRSREMSIRIALGASRWRLIRQSLVESLLLSSIGGAVGFLLAIWLIAWLLVHLPESFPRVTEISINRNIFIFTVAVSFLTGIVFGLVPAFQSAKSDVNQVLKAAARGGPHGTRLRRGLVVAEIALSLMLFIGAGLLIKSFWRLTRVDPGFNSNQLLTLHVALPERKYPNEAQVIDFYRHLPQRLSALPGVKAVSAVNHLPISGVDSHGDLTIEARTFGPGETPAVSYLRILPNYFRVMGIPLFQGREFDERDSDGQPDVVMINQKLAKRYWPNDDAVGKRIKVGPPENQAWMTIVGVVGNVNHTGLDTEPDFATYEPHAKRPWSEMTLLVRTDVDPTALAGPVRAELRNAEPEILIEDVITMSHRLQASVAPQRLNLVLLASFAFVALVLAAVGIYGVMTQTVEQRTHEIGVRMALGAEIKDVLRLVLRNGMSLAAIGVAIGLTGAFWATRLMAKLLFGVRPTDALVFASVAATLLVVAFLACYIPARRAAKVDPLVALRYE